MHSLLEMNSNKMNEWILMLTYKEVQNDTPTVSVGRRCIAGVRATTSSSMCFHQASLCFLFLSWVNSFWTRSSKLFLFSFSLLVIDIALTLWNWSFEVIWNIFLGDIED